MDAWVVVLLVVVLLCLALGLAVEALRALLVLAAVLVAFGVAQYLLHYRSRARGGRRP